jgi:hypothetical protein
LAGSNRKAGLLMMEPGPPGVLAAAVKALMYGLLSGWYARA